MPKVTRMCAVSFVRRAAAHSSSRGKDTCFNGTTLVFAYTRVTTARLRITTLT